MRGVLSALALVSQLSWCCPPVRRTGALSGIVHGIVGVKQTGVAWSTFVVKPHLANLKFVNATVPTIRGPIVVAATQDQVAVTMPCNTQAVLCVQNSNPATVETALMLNGVEIAATPKGQHLCTEAAVGCASSAHILSTTTR